MDNKKTGTVKATVPNVPSIKIGKITLPVNPQASTAPFVPQVKPLVNSISELETIALGIRENLPVLLIGDTGTGKTSFVRHLASLTGNSFRRLNLNGSTTVEELNGHYTADDKAVGLRWIDGILPEAMKNGYWLCLDELNASLPEILFVLQSVLDDDKFLVLPEHENEVVKPHPNFRIFATMNPSLEYAGTKDLNKALLSRFPIVIQTEYADPAREIEIIKTHAPKIDDKQAGLMVRVAEEIRKGKANNSLSFICSTRELINWAKLTEFMPVKQSAELALLNKVELPTDKKTVEDILKLQVGKWEKKELMTISDIEKQVEQSQAEMQSLKEQLKQAQSNKLEHLKFQQLIISIYKDLKTSYDKAKSAGKSTTKIKKLMDEISKTISTQAIDEEADDDNYINEDED